MHQAADVVFVSMPYAPLYGPSIALGLLKASLDGVSSHTFYFGFPFADRSGLPLYQDFAYRALPDHLLVGEWIFQPALFPVTPEAEAAYVEELLRPALPPEFVEPVLAARRIAPEFVDECAARVLALSPRIVAFTDVFQQNVASVALARRLKQARPEIFILFGGANCEGPMGPELLRRFPFIDACVSGEADQIFAGMIRRILVGQPLAAMPGVHTQASIVFGASPAYTAPVRNLDPLPYPDYDEFFEQWRDSPAAARVAPRVQMETSRGCWWGEVHHCTFCGLNGANMGFRAKSAQRALAELEYLTGRYPGFSVMLADNILDLAYFKEFLPELARRGLNVRLYYEIKANLKKSQIRLLRDAGVTQIQPGIESFSDAILGLMRKGIRGLQNVQLLKWCKELNVIPLWNLLWGFPGEPPAEYARMAAMLPRLSHLEPPRAALAVRLDRFSPNYEQSGEFGFANVRPAAAYRHIYPFDDAALRNLAYFFDYDYQEPRDVGGYVADLRSAVAEWRAVYEHSGLFAEDRGEQLWIWDLRPIAARPLTVLTGFARTLYLACDEVRGMGSLARLASAAEVEAVLGPLDEAGLILRDGDSVLSLAVLRSTDAPPRAGEPAAPAACREPLAVER